MKRFGFLFFFLFLGVVGAASADSVAYSAGKLYCNLTHPAEALSPIRQSTCEEQHVIQQQAGGGHSNNVVWWSASSHIRTDSWNDRPWQESRPWVVVGFTEEADVNLEKAYMLGTFGNSWSFFQHSYRGSGDSEWIFLEFDGVSNLLYTYSWFVNLPQKYLNKSAYIADKGNWHLVFDMLLAVLVLALEGVFAIFLGVLGVVIGTLLNPIDTVFAIPGGIWLGVETTIAAVAQYLLGVWRLIAAGFWGWVVLPFAVMLSVAPLMVLQKTFEKK